MASVVRKIVRPITSVVCILTLTGFASGTAETANIKTTIVGMSVGTSLEVRLKDKQKLRGARGVVSESAFTLVDARSGERQIAYSDVVSVKQTRPRLHTGRNILIGVGIGVGAAAIVIIALAHQGGYL